MSKKWVSYFMIVSFLTSTVVHPAISLAVSKETQSSQSQTEPSANALTTMSSDMLRAPNEPAVSEEESNVEVQDQEIHAEKTYDERDLSKRDEENGSQPFVQAEIDQEKLYGEIQLSSQSSDDSKTILEKVALQAKNKKDDWQETIAFEDSKAHVLDESTFKFEYKDFSEEQEYRLVVDYVIEEPNEGRSVVRIFHKGYFLFEQINKINKKEAPEKTKESTEKKSADQSITQNEQPTRTQGEVTPRAVNDVIYNGTGNKNPYVKIFNIKSREAFIEFKHQLYSNADYKRYAVWSTDQNRIIRLCANISSAGQIPGALWSELKADGTNVIVPFQKSWNDGSVTFGPGKMTNLEPNKTYYVWLFSVPPNESIAGWTDPQGTTSNVEKYISAPYVFTTDSAVALSLTAPTFTQTSATHNSVPMVGKNYTGDIFQTNTQGKVQVTSNDGTTFQDKVTNLGHTKTQGGTYNSTTVSGLTAGTRYKGRVSIKDYGGTWRYSPWSGYFYTANTVNQPTVPSQTAPTTSNNAIAQVSATYNAGDVAAHPTSTDIQISTNNSTWSTITADTTPAITNRVFNTGNKSVSFTLSKLNATSTYYVRYRVRNASNVWSGYSTSRGFTTGSVALALNTPTFTQTTATHNAIYMTGTTYTGDIFQTSGQGKVQVTSDDGTTVQDKITNLTHIVSRGGTYHNVTVPNLVAGTRYKGRVAIKDYGGTWRYSAWSTYFYTANTVNQPAVPTLNTPTAANNATAQVSATCNVGNVAAHPTSTDIQISTNNSTWSTITADTTPAITNRVFNTGNKSVTFTLSKLNSKTKYYVRYRVRNASNIWSGYSTSREFTTKGVPLVILPPVFDQATATATSIQMKQGTYSGDISQTANDGGIFTESYNSGTNNKDWTERVNNLQHTITTNGTYAATMVNGLTPGTRYRGWVQFKDAEGTTVGPVGQPAGAANEYFYTRNTLSSLSAPTLNTPVTENGATAEFSVDYQAAGDHPDQPAAHPNNVKIYLSTDGVVFSEIDSHSSNPSIDTFSFDTTNKKASVKIKNLTAGQTYYVKCSVVNQGGESEQTSARLFTTNQRQAGLYISDTPTFNFGVQPISSSVTTSGLTTNQGSNDFDIKLENVGINSKWSFAARLSSLQTQDGSNQSLTGAAISFDKQLQKTTDGINWQPVTQDFEGISNATTLLPSDSSTVQLWKTTNAAAGQGKFKTIIGFDSVSLIVPGNSAQNGTYYEGKIEWLMLSEP